MLLGCVFLGGSAASAGIVVPGADGSDGVLNITATTTIDLSQAIDGAWDQDNTANAGRGVYDADKWAVVFKYSSVTLASGTTVRFTNHPSRAPVVWLVNGPVSIDGNVILDGGDGVGSPGLAEPGPGGFRGGMGDYSAGVQQSAGFGPGGANWQRYYGWGGSFGTQGNSGPPPYGNPSLVPLIGGSGGGGDEDSSAGGGAGGGALLIACEQTFTLNGGIYARGGDKPWSEAGAGSGGGIRCVADDMAGAGVVNAIGGSANFAGGNGRIRLERVANSSNYQVTPDPSVVNLAPGATALIWPPPEAPQVEVISIGGEAPPADPRAGFGSLGADVALPETTTTEVVIETTNVEAASTVEVRVTPRTNTGYSTTVASLVSTVSADPLVLHWSADVPVTNGYSALQVKVVRP